VVDIVVKIQLIAWFDRPAAGFRRSRFACMFLTNLPSPSTQSSATKTMATAIDSQQRSSDVT